MPLELRHGGQVEHLVHGAVEVIEQWRSVGLTAGFPCWDGDHNPRGQKESVQERVQEQKSVWMNEGIFFFKTLPCVSGELLPLLKHIRSPVISYPVEEAVAMGHHGNHGTQNCSVAHQTGWQHKVTPTTTADTNTTQLQTQTWVVVFSLMQSPKSPDNKNAVTLH